MTARKDPAPPPEHPTPPPTAGDGARAHSYGITAPGRWHQPHATVNPPPPQQTEQVGGALCRGEPSRACGSCHMQGGSLLARGGGGGGLIPRRPSLSTDRRLARTPRPHKMESPGR